VFVLSPEIEANGGGNTMQAIAIRPEDRDAFGTLLTEMHRLRARVFGGRLGWDVEIADGVETDRFDQLNPVYILVVAERGPVLGCARLLPATGPTMLADAFPQLLAGGRLDAHPGMIESSRFCVDTGATEAVAARGLHRATLTLFAAIIEWSMGEGYREIVTATDVRFERLLNRAHWPMRRLGEPRMIGETLSIAGALPADDTSFATVRPQSYRSDLGGINRSAA
jgi:acyl homoserine lactone synthase